MYKLVIYVDQNIINVNYFIVIFTKQYEFMFSFFLLYNIDNLRLGDMIQNLPKNCHKFCTNC